jgi:hypothetical protein
MNAALSFRVHRRAVDEIVAAIRAIAWEEELIIEFSALVEAKGLVAADARGRIDRRCGGASVRLAITDAAASHGMGYLFFSLAWIVQ